jgi:uncharacterized repeat protein (TIGR01451 family)
MNRKVLVGVLCSGLMLATTGLVQAQVGTSGVTAGTEIINAGADRATQGIADQAGDLLATYLVAGSTKTVTAATVTITVGKIYGVGWGAMPSDKGAGPGQSVEYLYELVNKCNATGIFNLSLDTTGLPSGWSAEILKDGSPITTLTLAEDAKGTFTVKVNISSAANSGDQGVVVVKVSTTSDGDAYTVGDYIYGGLDALSDPATTTCMAAVLQLEKVAQVSLPAGYTGSNSNVPGSIITYIITYRNTGNDTASNVVVTDMIPAETTYVAGSLKMGTSGSTYDTADSKTDAKDIETGGSADWNVTQPGAVTFELGDVAAGTVGKLYFRVYIK